MPAAVEPPVVSPFLFDWFVWYTRRYLRKHFRQVLLDRRALGPLATDEPLVVCLNHPCWWDPLMGYLLAGDLFPTRTHYGVMDAHALDSYAIFKKLGVFGVERGSGQGAVRFLKVARQILSRPHAALWITPQGRYADVRERPVSLLPGLAHAVAEAPRCTVLTVALEYTFWENRLPIALARFGPPLRTADSPEATPAAWDERLAGALEANQDQLARQVMARDPTVFEVLIDGQQGLGNWYGWWRGRRPVPVARERPQEHALVP
jgi:1-acyl-sn-glycerol-3-phosphate acyltransferase